MSEANQGNHPDESALVPVKRKRGRPRKYPRLDLGHGVDVRAARGQNPNHGGSSYVPPGFVTVNGNQPRQVDPVNDASDIMVGQVVHGVIEAAFDAGYLLTVRVGNSETTLRGVVFKPGRCVPVSTDNDVAPGIQMIRRNEIPIPRENYAQVPSHNPRSRERNGTFHTAQAANPVASKGKQVPSMASHASSPGNSRGNVVPVVLHPVDLSNGTSGELSSVATQPADAVAFKGKRVLDAAHPSNGSTSTNQVGAVEAQLLHFQSQNNHQLMPSGLQKEAGVNQNLLDAQQEAEAKSMKLPGMPFEKLLTEVIKRTQVPSLSTKTDNGSAVNLSAKDSRRAAEDDVDGTGQPLYIEPLQSVQPVLHNHPAVVSRPLENYRTGRMTELLQKVLQENMTENQATNVQDEITDARLKLNEVSSSETEHGDEDSDHSKNHSRASSV
ncbi:protein METABOLIC NETWORK MODULATOR 1 isoform X1 [Hevea brasiliensis]|uniref:protein METABOLIC NETWORK MODULATOR 1 isoform X1 n=1 Tax=Hevea brasiliensis TaxID=3981 RepID=UPI0025E5DADF|nr:protein METABOLIC NETWORK MODULATOR 1 isoform X1 [Hevea brasiliensis]XP_058001343.1 protein METABOLIC NETWORK MODULATOR 1 isoform X1 [Hevea brasiliensis]XP_058001344.1 protein METABOLIC NETWORK MODULATOR 1 isoform X1 [Hevea brasiliensis]